MIEVSMSLAVPQMVPTCQILHTTAPSAWTSDSLTSMSSPAFSNCLELMGRDPFLTSYQRNQVLKRVRQVWGRKEKAGVSFSCKVCSWAVFHFGSHHLVFSICATSLWNHVGEDLRPGVLLLPVCDLSAGWSGCGAVSGGAEQPPSDWPQEHRCHGSGQHLEQPTGEHTHGCQTSDMVKDESRIALILLTSSSLKELATAKKVNECLTQINPFLSVLWCVWRRYIYTVN